MILGSISREGPTPGHRTGNPGSADGGSVFLIARRWGGDGHFCVHRHRHSLSAFFSWLLPLLSGSPFGVQYFHLGSAAWDGNYPQTLGHSVLKPRLKVFAAMLALGAPGRASRHFITGGCQQRNTPPSEVIGGVLILLEYSTQSGLANRLMGLDRTGCLSFDMLRIGLTLG